MFHEKEFLSFVFRTISKILHLPCSTDLFQTFLDSLNPFLANAPILYPMKTLENTPPPPPIPQENVIYPKERSRDTNMVQDNDYLSDMRFKY